MNRLLARIPPTHTAWEKIKNSSIPQAVPHRSIIVQGIREPVNTTQSNQETEPKRIVRVRKSQKRRHREDSHELNRPDSTIDGTGLSVQGGRLPWVYVATV